MTKKGTASTSKLAAKTTAAQTTAISGVRLTDAEVDARIVKQVDKAQRQFTDKLLLEAYGRKRKLLKLSFWQGVLFGLGSAIGGTLVLALLIWILARVVDWFPIMGDLINKIIEHTARR